MSRRAATGLGVALALVVLVGPASGTRKPDPLAPPSVREAALSAAAVNGDPHPTAGRAFYTTRDRVKEILQWADSEPDRPVYLVVVQGSFEYHGPSPPDVPPIRGDRIWFVWDPAARQAPDFGFLDSKTNDELDIEELGRGLSLGLGPGTFRG